MEIVIEGGRYDLGKLRREVVLKDGSYLTGSEADKERFCIEMDIA